MYLPGRDINNQVNLVDDSVNHISICAKTFTPDPKRVVVNAIGKFNLIFVTNFALFRCANWRCVLLVVVDYGVHEADPDVDG